MLLINTKMMLRTAVKVGSCFASPYGTLTANPDHAFWSVLSFRANRVSTIPFRLFYFLIFFKGKVFRFLITQIQHKSSSDSSSSSEEFCRGNFLKSGIEVLPLILESPGLKWTFCLHVDGPSDQKKRPSIITNSEGRRRDPEIEREPVKCVRRGPLCGAVGTLELIRVEANVDLIKEYSLSSVLSRCEMDENLIRTTPQSNIRIFPSHCTTPVKPPPTLLTYLALTNRGLDVIENSGFLTRAHEILKTNNRSLLEIRSYLWSIGHIASSEIGSIFLAQNQILQRMSCTLAKLIVKIALPINQ